MPIILIKKILFIGLIVIIPVLFLFFASQASADTATGTLESAISDLGLTTDFGVIDWTASTTASSTIAVYVRTGTTSDMISAPAWAGCAAVSDGADISANNCVADGHRYIQYKVDFECDYAATSTFAAPELSEISITYQSVGALVSSIYDTGASDSEIDSVYWSETLPGSSNILFQLRTSADGSAWTNWYGATSTDGFYADAAGNETIYSGFSDGVGDRYFQYKAYFDSGGDALPVLSDVTVAYTARVPVISALTPDYADDNSATATITISGSEFDDGAAVTLVSWGMEYDAATTSVGATEIVCELPLPQAHGGWADVKVTNENGAYTTKQFWIKSQAGFFISAANDLGGKLNYNSASWSADVPASTTLALKFRSANDASMAGADDWSACSAIASGANPVSGGCVSTDDDYLQYRADFSAEYPAAYIASSSYIASVLQEVSVSYDHYASGTLISSPYNFSDPDAVIIRLSWSESLPAGTDVKIQLRTAPDNGGAPGAWSSWFGGLGIGTYFSNIDNSVSAAYQQTGRGWIQYQILLDTDGLNASVLSDIELEYTSDSGIFIFKTPAIFKENTILK